MADIWSWATSPVVLILAGFHIAILLILALDLGLWQRTPHGLSMKEAAAWSVAWVVLAVAFAAGIWQFWDQWHPADEGRGGQKAVEFITGYLVEKALSVDNLFVFLVIFRYFAVPAPLQHRVLVWGIAGAILLRATLILAGAAPKAEGVHGRPNLVTAADGTQRVGRFGWKADTASLEVFVAEAMRNELGITSPLAPFDFPSAHTPGSAPCAGEVETADGATVAAALSAYVGSLPPPAPRRAAENAPGAAVFARVGCADCHTPALHANGQEVGLHSDLLLHDMGPDLADGLPQGEAGGTDWRTTPLWGLGQRARLLHDARARTLEAAIAAHGGEAGPARSQFRDLPEADRATLLAFLSSL